MKEFFRKFSEVLESKLMPVADKIGKQRHLAAVKDGMLAYVPFTIIASVFLIIAYIPIRAYEMLKMQEYGKVSLFMFLMQQWMLEHYMF